MATINLSVGYGSEFIDQVNEVFYCNKCGLVARRLTLTGCCGESYCHTCIAEICQQGRPCPDCGKKSFTILEQLKYQQRIKALRAYCSMKERGCGWSGTLEQLDTHLHPDQDSCQYVDTKCPLNCSVTIPKNKVEQHVAEECTKRLYVCQHCAFKATYEEVMGTHLSECKYVPLQCPNRCGVTCDREDMEDHMKMCRLEEVVCMFQRVGCKERFVREDEGDHSEKSIQQHLILTAAEAIEANEQLERKLQDQEQRMEKWEHKLMEQEKRLQEQEIKLLREQEKKLQDQEKQLQEHYQAMQEQYQAIQQQKQNQLEKKLDRQAEEIKSLQYTVGRKDLLLDTLTKHFDDASRRFEVRNFHTISNKATWTSPAMYTHTNGYKFFIEVTFALMETMCVILYPIQGEYDDQLKWPVEATITIAMLNQQGGEDEECTKTTGWSRPSGDIRDDPIWFDSLNLYFKDKSKLKCMVFNDTMYFHVKQVVFNK